MNMITPIFAPLLANTSFQEGFVSFRSLAPGSFSIPSWDVPFGPHNLVATASAACCSPLRASHEGLSGQNNIPNPIRIAGMVAMKNMDLQDDAGTNTFTTKANRMPTQIIS